MNKIKKIIFSGLICITLTNTVIKSGQAGTGGVFSNLDMLAVSSSTFNSNSGDGFAISDSSSAQVNSTTANNNAATGTTATNLGKGNSYWNNVTTNANGQHGFSADATYNMVMTNPISNSNGANGLHFINSANITTNNAITNSNMGNHGASFSNVDALIATINSNNNVNGGINLSAVTAFRLAQSVVHQNGAIGVAVVNSQGGQIENHTSTFNGQHGMYLDPATTNVVVRGSTANNNVGMGFFNQGGISNIHKENNANANGTNFSGVTSRVQQFETSNKNIDEDALAGINNLSIQTETISTPGTHDITRTYTGQIIIAASNVTLDLNGNIFTGDNSQTGGTPPAGIISVLPNLENIIIRNGTIALINGLTAPTVGINIDQSNRVVIQNIVIANTNSSGTAIGIQATGTNGTHLNNLVIDNTVISNTPTAQCLNGISIAYCDNVLMQQYKTSSNLTGLNIAHSINGVLVDCTLSANTTGIVLNTCDNYELQNCNSSGNTNSGISIVSCMGCSISNCTTVDNSDLGIALSSCTGCLMNQCIANNNLVGLSIAISSSHCTIDNCTATNSGAGGFSIEASSDCEIRNSIIKGQNGVFSAAGIQISSNSACILVSNCSIYNFAAGILITDSTNCCVENSTIACNQTGVFIGGSSLNCQVKDCSAFSNSLYGFLDNSSGSITDGFFGNIAHTNPTNYSPSISPTTSDQVNAQRYNNLSV